MPFMPIVELAAWLSFLTAAPAGLAGDEVRQWSDSRATEAIYTLCGAIDYGPQVRPDDALLRGLLEIQRCHEVNWGPR